MVRIASLVGAVVFALASQAQAHQLVKKWETAAEIAVPESVYLDRKRNVLYTSNIDGEPWGDDGKGSVGKVSLDGKVIAAEWVTGLSAPKGLAMVGNLLYVADMTMVVVIDVDKGEIAKRIPVPGAQGLNDATATPAGVVYVSDSLGKKLFAIRDGKPELVLDNLKGPNGVLSHDGALYMLDDGSAFKVGADHSLKPITSGMAGVIDGIEPVSANEFLISTWGGTVMYVKADGTRETLLDTTADKINAADIAYDQKTRTLYVPTFFHKTIAAYELK